MNLEGLVDLLKELLRCPSVVGAEHSFFRVLQRTLEERGAKVTWYEGLLVAQGDEPESSLFSAHIDRHGLICTGPDEFQYAAFVAGGRSDLLGNSVSEQMMARVADRFRSLPVWAYEPWSGAYLGTGTVLDAHVCPYRNNLVFEVEGLSHLVAGTPVALRDALRQVDGRLVGQLDNVLTAAILVHLFGIGYRGTAFFTAQEESGRSWRYLLEWFRRFGSSTRKLIVLDTSPFPDVGSADAQQVVLRWRDANAEFDPETTAALERCCRELGHSYLFKDRFVEERNRRAVERGDRPHSIGSTELGRTMMASEGWVGGTTLQIPTTGYHTMEESAAIASCEAFLAILLRLSGTTHASA
jgi:hypothetical protein